MSSGGPSITGIIPARWASSRFPGKPLHPIAGRPLIQHVWDRCRQCTTLDDLLIATDDARIAAAADGFGARVVMTSDQHLTGTDRLAEAIAALPQAEIIVNIQGDEPLIDPDLVDALATALQHDPACDMATAAHPLAAADPAIDDPHVVKVVTSLDHRALYFSRSPIPYRRDAAAAPPTCRHLGLYAYRRRFLECWPSWPPSPLEQAESLEQLRALENGASIHVLLTSAQPPGVDTPEQALAIESLLAS